MPIRTGLYSACCYFFASCLLLIAAADGRATTITRIPESAGVVAGSIIVSGNDDLLLVVIPGPGNTVENSIVKGIEKLFVLKGASELKVVRIVSPLNAEYDEFLNKFLQHRLLPRLLAGVLFYIFIRDNFFVR